jgi:hypothetical protein
MRSTIEWFKPACRKGVEHAGLVAQEGRLGTYV